MPTQFMVPASVLPLVHAAISVLPAIADAVQGDVPVIMDSGIRRGTDIAKTPTLGANAAAVGRPVWWSLALGGAGGVNGVMEDLDRKPADTMLHPGVDGIGSPGSDPVTRAVDAVAQPGGAGSATAR